MSALDGPESPRYTFLLRCEDNGGCLHTKGHRHLLRCASRPAWKCAFPLNRLTSRHTNLLPPTYSGAPVGPPGREYCLI